MTEADSARRKLHADLIIVGANEVLTCVPTQGDPSGSRSGVSLVVSGERIAAVGPAADIAQQFETTSAVRVDARGKVVAPGFVDSHTHLVFGGSRAREYAARLTHRPEELQSLGIPTGILATVEMTRALSMEELLASAASRVESMLRHGTTTLESKSGYGLGLTEEMKLLKVNRALDSAQPVDVVSTFLGAHAFPPEVSRQSYLEQVIEDMIPRVAASGLAEFCDVYCDEGYFTAEESRRILLAGQRAGLKPKIHVDAYSAIGGSAVAAELGVVSADHLNYTDRAALRRLAQAGVTAVGMPALDFAVAHPRPFDARSILDEGLPLALATDLCPACWTESVQLVMQLACRQYHLSPAEALYAATAGGARAIDRLHDRGSLEAGKLADLQIWDVPSLDEGVYRLGHNAVAGVIKRGRLLSFGDDRALTGVGQDGNG